MLRRYVEQILSLYNYIDGMMVTNKEGFVEYFTTFRPELNNLKEEDVLGKHVLEVYPMLTEETSSVLRVLKDSKPIYNERQQLTTYKGQSIYAVNSTLPIKSGDEIIGAVDVSRYVAPNIERKDIVLSLRDKVLPPNNTNLFCVDDIISDTPSMSLLKEKVTKVATTNSSVLIYGETGTGKEMVAQALHTHSHRALHPFISQNCAAIPSTLLESILFGTTKGSYTGAEDKKGLFQLAEGGTLFLDEINSMEFSIQAKILKAIEEKKILKVGGLKPININVRIVSAVNENPQKAILENRLREDLFYRLGVVQLYLPNLRERKKDILLLTNYFINIYNRQMNRNVIGISEQVERTFKNYPWPGNVRELRNLIEGAFNLLSGNLIQAKDLPEYLYQRQDFGDKKSLIRLGSVSLPEMIKNYEKEIIIKALEQSKNMVEAGKLLQISKQSLKYKIEKYSL